MPALTPPVRFLGIEVALPASIEIETDESTRDTLSGKRIASGGSLHRLRLGFALIGAAGDADIEAVSIAVAAHKAKHGRGRSFAASVPQRYGFRAPSAAVNTRASSTYNLNQTSIQIVTGGSVVVQSGAFFTMPGADTKIYEVVEGRTGSGAIIIRPGLRMAYSGAAAALDFAPQGRFYHDSDSFFQYRHPSRSNDYILLVEAL